MQIVIVIGLLGDVGNRLVIVSALCVSKQGFHLLISLRRANLD